jgi:hypothetical protein
MVGATGITSVRVSPRCVARTAYEHVDIIRAVHQLEAQQAAVVAEQLGCARVLGVLRQTGVVDARHLGVRRQRAGQRQRIAAGAFHAQRHGLGADGDAVLTAA